MTDEETFARAFGGCDWSVMAILGRTGNTYARLRFPAGPGGAMTVPVTVDWSAWPQAASNSDCPLSEHIADWQREYATLVEAIPPLSPDAMLFDDPFAEDPVLLRLASGAPDLRHPPTLGDRHDGP